jgi:hypothetical protein
MEIREVHASLVERGSKLLAGGVGPDRADEGHTASEFRCGDRLVCTLSTRYSFVIAAEHRLSGDRMMIDGDDVVEVR